MKGHTKQYSRRLDAFERELAPLVNAHSLEEGSDTPDFQIAKYLRRCLEAYNEVRVHCARWHGESVPPKPRTV